MEDIENPQITSDDALAQPAWLSGDYETSDEQLPEDNRTRGLLPLVNLTPCVTSEGISPQESMRRRPEYLDQFRLQRP